jgi:hypothetical protein
MRVRDEPDRFAPKRSADDRDALHDGWLRAVRAALAWAQNGS